MISEIENSIYKELEADLLKFGFVLYANKKQFRKTTIVGFQNIVITTSSVNGKTWVEVNFGIRHNRLEQIVHQFLDQSIEFQEDTNTIIISVGKFNDDKYFNFEIENENDVKDECIAIIDFFIQTGFDFLNNNSSIDQIDRLLNQFPNKNCKFIYNQTNRYYKGLVAAKLSNNKNFLNIGDAYKTLLLKNNSTGLECQKYNSLFRYMQHLSLN